MSKYVYHAGLMPTVSDVSPTTGKTCGYTTLIVSRSQLSNSYTMGCPPVGGNNPRALASRLSYVQVDKHGIII